MLSLPTPHHILDGSSSDRCLIRFGTHYDTNYNPTPYVLCSVNDGIVSDAWVNFNGTIVADINRIN